MPFIEGWTPVLTDPAAMAAAIPEEGWRALAAGEGWRALAAGEGWRALAAGAGAEGPEARPPGPAAAAPDR